jgi:hypothetical protein
LLSRRIPQSGDPLKRNDDGSFATVIAVELEHPEIVSVPRVGVEVFLIMARPRTKGGEQGDKLPHIGAIVSQELFDRFNAFCKERLAVNAAVIVRAVEQS